MNDNEDAVFRDQLARLGREQVRLLLQTAGFVEHHARIARQWIAELEREDEAAGARLEAEQLEIARSANDAAWAAARAAARDAEAAERAATAAERAAAAAERAARASERANGRATVSIIVAAIGIAISMIVAAVSIVQHH